MLFAFSGMLRFGIAASLLSLGAIDFGMVVDSSVVMVENCVRHLAHGDAQGRSRLDVIRDAAVEVRKPTMFGELIIMIVYLPILTLEGIEGKLFRPMALTVIFALAGSMVLSLTLMPVLASLLLPRRPVQREPLLMRLAHGIHAPVLRFAMNHKVAGARLRRRRAGGRLRHDRAEPRLASSCPRLSEGAIAINVVRLAGTDLDESVRYNTQMEKAVLADVSRRGAARLEPRRHGRSRHRSDGRRTDRHVHQPEAARTLEEGAHAGRADRNVIEKHLRELPGQKLSFSQPIEMRMNEMISGVRADVAVKLFGDDLDDAGEEGERDRGGPADDARRRRRGGRADHRPAGACRSRSSRTRSPATAFRPRPCSTWSSRSAASRWAKSSRASCVSRWWSVCRRSCGAVREASKRC